MADCATSLLAKLASISKLETRAGIARSCERCSEFFQAILPSSTRSRRRRYPQVDSALPLPPLGLSVHDLPRSAGSGRSTVPARSDWLRTMADRRTRADFDAVIITGSVIVGNPHISSGQCRYEWNRAGGDESVLPGAGESERGHHRVIERGDRSENGDISNAMRPMRLEHRRNPARHHDESDHDVVRRKLGPQRRRYKQAQDRRPFQCLHPRVAAPLILLAVLRYPRLPHHFVERLRRGRCSRFIRALYDRSRHACLLSSSIPTRSSHGSLQSHAPLSRFGRARVAGVDLEAVSLLTVTICGHIQIRTPSSRTVFREKA